LLINVDVSASTAAFVGTVCLIAVRRRLTNYPTATTSCSPRNWAARGY